MYLNCNISQIKASAKCINVTIFMYQKAALIFLQCYTVNCLEHHKLHGKHLSVRACGPLLYFWWTICFITSTLCTLLIATLLLKQKCLSLSIITVIHYDYNLVYLPSPAFIYHRCRASVLLLSNPARLCQAAMWPDYAVF